MKKLVYSLSSHQAAERAMQAAGLFSAKGSKIFMCIAERSFIENSPGNIFLLNFRVEEDGETLEKGCLISNACAQIVHTAASFFDAFKSSFYMDKVLIHTVSKAGNNTAFPAEMDHNLKTAAGFICVMEEDAEGHKEEFIHYFSTVFELQLFFDQEYLRFKQRDPGELVPNVILAPFEPKPLDPSRN